MEALFIVSVVKYIAKSIVHIRNSITIDRKIYLLEAFPYIVTEARDDPSNEVDISISDIYGNNVSFKKKIVRNRIYLYDFDNVSCGEIKIYK